MKHILIVLLALFIVGVSQAQNETGSRYLNNAMFKKSKMWYDSSTAVFQKGFPIIRNIPPLNSGMPFEVMMSYIYLDSLLRYGNEQLIIDTYKKMSSINDTLKGALKFLYVMDNYNPIIFNQYMGEVRLHKTKTMAISAGNYEHGDSNYIPYPAKYNVSLKSLKEKVCNKFLDLYTQSDKFSMYSILYADYILRVRINEIDSMINKNSSLHDYRFNVRAAVLDTFKGRMFSGQQLQTFGSSIPPGFTFQFTSFNYGMMYVEDPNVMYTKGDTAFMDGSMFHMRVNQEAIVFISFHDQYFDYTKDYFNVELEPRCSFNALRIENGNVIDVNHVWSNNDTIPYDDWKQLYFSTLNKILNLTY